MLFMSKMNHSTVRKVLIAIIVVCILLIGITLLYKNAQTQAPEETYSDFDIKLTEAIATLDITQGKTVQSDPFGIAFIEPKGYYVITDVDFGSQWLAYAYFYDKDAVSPENKDFETTIQIIQDYTYPKLYYDYLNGTLEKENIYNQFVNHRKSLLEFVNVTIASENVSIINGNNTTFVVYDVVGKFDGNTRYIMNALLVERGMIFIYGSSTNAKVDDFKELLVSVQLIK